VEDEPSGLVRVAGMNDEIERTSTAAAALIPSAGEQHRNGAQGEDALGDAAEEEMANAARAACPNHQHVRP